MVAALPYLVMVIMVQVGGQVADWAQINNIMSVTNIRKSLNCTGRSGAGNYSACSVTKCSMLPIMKLSIKV